MTTFSSIIHMRLLSTGTGQVKLDKKTIRSKNKLSFKLNKKNIHYPKNKCNIRLKRIRAAAKE